MNGLVSPFQQVTKALRETRGISLLCYWTSTLEGKLSTLGKDPVPIVQEAGWDPGQVWTDAENLAPTGFRSPDCPARSQSLYWLSYRASRYTDWATGPTKDEWYIINIKWNNVIILFAVVTYSCFILYFQNGTLIFLQ
jgi:hypothetical protein